LTADFLRDVKILADKFDADGGLNLKIYTRENKNSNENNLKRRIFI